jgi:hypothetical protein
MILAMAASLLLATVAGAGAQSPGPLATGTSPAASSSAVPAGSTAPGATSDLICEDLAGLLPRSLSAWPLVWSAAEGAAEPIPGYPVADLASSLGITPADICTVTFHYNEVVDGTIVRFAGAEQDGLLDAYVADAAATYLTKGYQLLTQPLDLSGRPGIELMRDGYDRTAWQVGDMIVEMPTGWADEVSAYLPADGTPLPQVSPPPPAPTEPPVMKALNRCAKLFDYLSGADDRIHLAGDSGFGPDVIDQSGTLLDPTASPAIMTDGLFDKLDISPFDVCLERFTYGDSEGKIWQLGKGGAGTLQAYLDDVTATVEANGGTVEQGTDKIGKKKVTTLTVSLPTGDRTYYYLDLGGKAFLEAATLDVAKQVIPIVVIPRKK